MGNNLNLMGNTQSPIVSLNGQSSACSPLILTNALNGTKSSTDIAKMMEQTANDVLYLPPSSYKYITLPATSGNQATLLSTHLLQPQHLVAAKSVPLSIVNNQSLVSPTPSKKMNPGSNVQFVSLVESSETVVSSGSSALSSKNHNLALLTEAAGTAPNAEYNTPTNSGNEIRDAIKSVVHEVLLDNDDEEMAFCRSLAASLRVLDRRQKEIAKFKLQQVMLGITNPEFSLHQYATNQTTFPLVYYNGMCGTSPAPLVDPVSLSGLINGPNSNGTSVSSTAILAKVGSNGSTSGNHVISNGDTLSTSTVGVLMSAQSGAETSTTTVLTTKWCSNTTLDWLRCSSQQQHPPKYTLIVLFEIHYLCFIFIGYFYFVFIKIDWYATSRAHLNCNTRGHDRDYNNSWCPLAGVTRPHSLN